MYGKVFQSLYTGTLSGHAHEILVFTNMIAFKDQDQYVDKHPRVIAAEVGLTVEQVQAAIDNLEGPDPESRSPDKNGARIVRADEHRSWGWYVVNGEFYDKIRNREERREQNRQAQQRKRAKDKAADRQQPSADVINGNQCQPTDQETETEIPPAPRGASTARKPGQKATEEMMLTVGSLFGRTGLHEWASHEMDALLEHAGRGILTDDNLHMLRRHFTKMKAEKRGQFIPKLKSFLRDPMEQIDKARAEMPPRAPKPIPGATSAHEPPPDAVGFPKGAELTRAIRESLKPTTKPVAD